MTVDPEDKNGASKPSKSLQTDLINWPKEMNGFDIANVEKAIRNTYLNHSSRARKELEREIEHWNLSREEVEVAGRRYVSFRAFHDVANAKGGGGEATSAASAQGQGASDAGSMSHAQREEARRSSKDGLKEDKGRAS